MKFSSSPQPNLRRSVLPQWSSQGDRGASTEREGGLWSLACFYSLLVSRATGSHLDCHPASSPARPVSAASQTDQCLQCPEMAMDLCYSHQPILPEDGDLLLDCQSLLLDQSSDAGYYSACSSGSLSPTSSVDSCCLSPPATLFGGLGGFSEIPECFTFQQAVPRLSGVTATAAAVEESSVPQQRGRKSRSKYPGRKRQSASEREKLRMRDLTKALHHLRTYLPASVAPVGQTLTKIETLRLTIRYIAHLSAQLGHDDQELAQSSPSDRLQDPCLPYSQQAHTFRPQPSPPMPQHLQASSQLHQLQAPQPQPQPHACSPALGAFPTHAPLQTGSLLDGFLSQPTPEPLHGSYQNSNDITYAQDFCFTQQELWVPSQQNMFYGLC
ncbi:hypothetical protein ACEWY4_026565 [Coilia grayii]|uniref:BHLH domain-containing protein n=1 Tax=Coilia grayii TaxID=363190 RepID=A0ABD1ISY1_9TELE